MNIDDRIDTTHSCTAPDDYRNSNTKIFIGGIRETVGNDQLQKEFEHCGQINKVWIARSPFSKGYAFIEFAESSDANRAVREMNGKELFGSKRILVQISKQKRGIQKCDSYDHYQDSGTTLNQNYSFKDSNDVFNLRNSSKRSSRSRSPESLTEYGCTYGRRSSLRRSPKRSTYSNPSRKETESRSFRSTSSDRLKPSRSRHWSPRPRSRSRSASRGRHLHKEDSKLKDIKTIDDETVSKIKESVIKESIPHMYAMFAKEMIAMMQNQSNMTVFPQATSSFQASPVQNAQMYNEVPSELNSSPYMRKNTHKMTSSFSSSTDDSTRPTTSFSYNSSPQFPPPTTGSYFQNTTRNSAPLTVNKFRPTNPPAITGYYKQAQLPWVRYPVKESYVKTANSTNNGAMNFLTPPQDM